MGQNYIGLDHVMPIFKELISTELLQNGRTQNQNQLFNAMIWECILKTSYVSLSQPQLLISVFVIEPIF